MYSTTNMLHIYLQNIWKNCVLIHTSLPLTITIVNLKIPKNSNKNPILPPGLQDSSQHVGESPDSLNLLSRISSRAGKQVHSRERL